MNIHARKLVGLQVREVSAAVFHTTSAAYKTVFGLVLLAVPHASEVTMLPSHKEVR